ncbi:hypothetical protein M8I35_22400 [Micromonospora sp. MSM11]|nr:hypothetical protein [Micromonospora sp. MSM11]MCL7459931.1 hypothetical protein [Micromonospora sp. MSM11]
MIREHARAQAAERAIQHRQAYLIKNFRNNDRDWLKEAFGYLAGLRAAGKIFDPHNPVWRFDISGPAAEELSDFFRRGAVKEFGLAATHGAGRDSDGSELIGWARWDHLARAQALATVHLDRKTQEAWPAERLLPLLAGLVEIEPWLHHTRCAGAAIDRANAGSLRSCPR